MSELKKYKGKEIVFTSNKSRKSIFPKRRGTVGEMTRTEAYLDGDWHEIKSLEIVEVIK